MQHVAEEDRVDARIRQLRIVGRREYRRQVRRRVLGGDLEQLRIDIHRVNLAGVPREPPREVAGSRADVGNGLVGPQLERHHHLVRLLPGVPPRVLEHLCILVRRPRRMMLMLHLSQRASRQQYSEADSLEQIRVHPCPSVALPRCSATTPKVILSNSTFREPGRRIIAANPSASGNLRTDSGRYV